MYIYKCMNSEYTKNTAAGKDWLRGIQNMNVWNIPRMEIYEYMYMYMKIWTFETFREWKGKYQDWMEGEISGLKVKIKFEQICFRAFTTVGVFKWVLRK